MNIIMEAFIDGFGTPEKTPITEGWGTVLVKVLGTLSTTANMGGAAVMATASKISNDFLRQALKDKEIVKYIKGECDKILKEEKKKDKSVTKKMPSGVIASIKRWWHSDDGIKIISWTRIAHWRNRYEDDLLYNFDVDGYNITFFYDTDHIDAAVVVLYSEDTNAIFGRVIPAPSKADLSKSFHKE